MADIDVTVVVDTVSRLGTEAGRPICLQRRGPTYEDRVKVQWGDTAAFYVNLSSLRDAVKILGAV
jgi:hypothetical protein